MVQSSDHVKLILGWVLVEPRIWHWNLETQLSLFFLLLFPEIINNDVKNNIDAGADNEEEKPQIYHLEKLVNIRLPNWASPPTFV